MLLRTLFGRLIKYCKLSFCALTYYNMVSNFAHKFRWQKCDLPGTLHLLMQNISNCKIFRFICTCLYIFCFGFLCETHLFSLFNVENWLCNGNRTHAALIHKSYLCVRTTQTPTRSRFLAIPFILFRSSFFYDFTHTRLRVKEYHLSS